jgi:hypothetical protein
MQRSRLAKIFASLALFCAAVALIVVKTREADEQSSLLSSLFSTTSSEARVEVKRSVSNGKRYIVSFDPSLSTGFLQDAAAQLRSLEWFSFGLVKAVIVDGADVEKVVAVLKNSKVSSGVSINDLVIAIEEDTMFDSIRFILTKQY